MTKIIGLTGGIATGKSTVSTMFKQADIPVIDADSIAKSLLDKNTIVYNDLLDFFGESILSTDKNINRNKLANKIFHDADLRQKVNAIVHPKVKTIMTKEIEHFNNLEIPWVVIDVPLLFETDFYKLADVTVLVYARQKDQIERLMLRDSIDETYAKQKIKTQFPLYKKKELADYVIDNSKSILETKKAFQRLLKKLKIKQ
jgi:dephospho-CoA kinase